MERLWIRSSLLNLGCVIAFALCCGDVIAQDERPRVVLNSATAEVTATYTIVKFEGNEIGDWETEDENPIVQISLFQGQRLLTEVPRPESDEPPVCEPCVCNALVCEVRFDRYYEPLKNRTGEPLVLKIKYKDGRKDTLNVSLQKSP